MCQQQTTTMMVGEVEQRRRRRGGGLRLWSTTETQCREIFPMTILFVFRALCLHCCRRQVLPCLGTLPSSPHRSHRRPLVVQSQLSSQPVAGCRLMLARSRMLGRSLFALSMPVVCLCVRVCLSALNFPGNDLLLLLLLWSPRALTMDTQSAA